MWSFLSDNVLKSRKQTIIGHAQLSNCNSYQLPDSIAKNTTKTTKSNETALEDAALDDAAARKEFCKTKCYDINVAGINCRIICHPPHIDTTGGLQMMQQLPYQPCTDPTCGAGQNPCQPQGCTPGYPQQYGNPYGGVIPPTNVYTPNPGFGLRHPHHHHHGPGAGKKKGKKDKKAKKGKKAKKDKKAKKGKKGKKVEDKQPGNFFTCS